MVQGLVSIILGVVTGLALGVAIGCIKYFALWKGMKHKGDDKQTMGALYIRMGIGYALNVLTLFLVFITRNLVPLNFMATIVAAAIGLTVMNNIKPVKDAVAGDIARATRVDLPEDEEDKEKNI